MSGVSLTLPWNPGKLKGFSGGARVNFDDFIQGKWWTYPRHPIIFSDDD